MLKKGIFFILVLIIVGILFGCSKDNNPNSSVNFKRLRIEESSPDKDDIPFAAKLSSFERPDTHYDIERLMNIAINDFEDKFDMNEEGYNYSFYYDEKTSLVVIELENPDQIEIEKIVINEQSVNLDQAGIYYDASITGVRIDASHFYDDDDEEEYSGPDFILNEIIMEDGPVYFEENPVASINTGPPILEYKNRDIINVTPSSFDFDYKMTDERNLLDADNTQVMVYLFDENGIVTNTEMTKAEDTISFTDLESTKKYFMTFVIGYDNLDGQGFRTEIVRNEGEDELFLNPKTDSYSDLTIDKTTLESIKIKLEPSTDDISIESVELWDYNGNLVSTEPFSSNIEFRNLESATQYYFKINYTNGITDTITKDNQIMTDAYNLIFRYYSKDYFLDNFRMDQHSLENFIPNELDKDDEQKQQKYEFNKVVDSPWPSSNIYFDSLHSIEQYYSYDGWLIEYDGELISYSKFRDMKEKVNKDTLVVPDISIDAPDFTIQWDGFIHEFIRYDDTEDNYSLHLIGDEYSFTNKDLINLGGKNGSNIVHFGEYFYGEDFDLLNNENNLPFLSEDKLDNLDDSNNEIHSALIYDPIEYDLKEKHGFESLDYSSKEQLNVAFGEDYYETDADGNVTKVFLPERYIIKPDEKHYIDGTKSFQYITSMTSNLILPNQSDKHPDFSETAIGFDPITIDELLSSMND